MLYLYYCCAMGAVGKRYLCLQSSTEMLMQQQVWDYLQESAPLSRRGEAVVYMNEPRERVMFS